MKVPHPIIDPNTYDSRLTLASRGQPATLEIKLRIALLPRDPSGDEGSVHLAGHGSPIRRGKVEDYDGQPYDCRSWNEHEWDAFIRSFKIVVETTWNNQMLLLPPESLTDDEYRKFISSPDVPAHIAYVLNISVQPPEMPDDDRPYMEIVHLQKPENGEFRSQKTRIDNEDVYIGRIKSSTTPGEFLHQYAAAHEAGHWLRQPGDRHFAHVDFAYCRDQAKAKGEEPDSQCQYGHTLAKERAIMGGGSLATEYEATPWMARARMHTGIMGGWKMAHRYRLNHGSLPVSEHQRRLMHGHKR